MNAMNWSITMSNTINVLLLSWKKLVVLISIAVVTQWLGISLISFPFQISLQSIQKNKKKSPQPILKVKEFSAYCKRNIKHTLLQCNTYSRVLSRCVISIKKSKCHWVSNILLWAFKLCYLSKVSETDQGPLKDYSKTNIDSCLHSGCSFISDDKKKSCF